MREETRIAIENFKAVIGDRYFKAEDTKGFVSVSTLRKYGLIKSEEYIASKEEYSLEALVDELNDREGEDCWYDSDLGSGEWVVENGKAYYIWKTWGYRFI